MKNTLSLFGMLIAVAFLFTACNSESNGPVEKAKGEVSDIRGESTETVEAIKVGDKAPAFSLKNVDGEMISLADYEGKGAIVVFTCNHCPFSVLYEDRIIDLQKKYADSYPVIAINPNSPTAEPEDGYEEMIVRAKEKGFNFPYLFDDGQKIYPQYGANRTPHVFLLDKAHNVRYIGAIDDSARDTSAVKVNYIDDSIKAINAGKDPEPNFTKAIGCTIKS
jgi:peroxiredoxin